MSLLLDVFERARQELFDEAVEAFTAFHGRIPSLAEEGTEYERITPEKIKFRLAQLIGKETVEMDVETAKEINSILDKMS